MAISGFNTTIAQLSGSSTFYEWVFKENNEIISKLNLAKVADVTGGDILASLTPSSGLVTLSLGGTAGLISRGLTFDNTVEFIGETILPSVSYKITGITSGTVGFTFGSIVRITETGYTAARANNPDAAEVVGVITKKYPTHSIVTLSGRIIGDFTEVNSGSTLSPGCVYFLSGQTAGNISITEPSTIGYVSKPVIVGLGATSGIVVQYRGNYLNSDAGGGNGSSGSNRLFITLPTSPTDPRTVGFSAGTFLSYAPNVVSGNTFFAGYLTDTGRTSIDGWFLSGSKNYVYSLYSSDSEYYNIPREEDFIVGMVETVTTSGGNVVYQVLTRGTTDIIPKSFLTGTAKGPWLISGTTYEISSTGITMQLKQQPVTTTTSFASGYQVGLVFQDTPTYWFVNPRPLSLPPSVVSVSSSGTVSSLASNINYTFNGDFEIWQRTTGKNSAYTTSGNVYFADNWVRRQNNTPSSVQSLERKTFNVESRDVEGTPKNYVDIKCLIPPGTAWSNSSTSQYSIGHILEGINTLNGQNITVSFYAKCATNTLTSQNVRVYMARYSNGSLVGSRVTIGTVSIKNTSWEKKTLNFTVPNLSAGSYTNDYVEIGFDLQPTIQEAYSTSTPTSTNLTFSFASLVVYRGTFLTPTHTFDEYNDKLEKCQRYYYSTYTDSQTPGTNTMLSQYEPVLNALRFTYTPQAPFSLIKLPVSMRSTPSVIIYSPYEGLANEAFNYTAQKNLRNCNDAGYEGRLRNAPSGAQTISTAQDSTSVLINLIHGIVFYDVISCHVVADASYTL